MTKLNKVDKGSSVGAYIEFAPSVKKLSVIVCSSFISYDQALINLDKEIGKGKTLAKVSAEVKKNGQGIWIR